MKTIIAVVAAIVLGAAIGTGTAALRARHPALVAGAKVAVDAESFEFGELDSAKEGSHDFKFTNKGTTPLVLTRGATSCRCTLGEIADPVLAPEQTTTVHVSWKSKHVVGQFKQTVTINTNDPNRPQIVLTIQGEFTEPLHTVPDELSFGQIVGNKPVAKETRIFCNLPGQPLEIEKHEFTDHELARFFQLDTRPLKAAELRDQHGAVSGVLVKVTAKPGLPPGRFQQRILLRTNLPLASEVDLPVFGSMGKDVSIVGAGWDDDLGVLNIGAVKAKTAVQRQLLLMARGSDAKDVRYKVVHVEPEFLKVTLGETKLSEGGKLSQTMLTIEIPPRSAPASYMDDGHGRPGEIHIDTTSSEVHQVQIKLRFAVEGDAKP